MRSGIVLAGGQSVFFGETIPSDIEDGVLTAAEISKMNLFNTDLVVLSACQTGLGDVKGSEGVYGMQRAFKMAGVDYLIYSLWRVPDKTTQELMSEFYHHLIQGENIEKSFNQAQKYIRNKYKNEPDLAYYWAAFVLMK